MSKSLIHNKVNKDTKKDNNDFDVIIPIGTRDCLIAKKVIQYISLNIKPKCIYVIVNNGNNFFFSKSFCDLYSVKVLDENNLIKDLNMQHIIKMIDKRLNEDGRYYAWYFQQILKMAFSLTSCAKDYYLIWDADTLPLNKLHFFDEGRPVFTPKNEYHKPYFDTIQKLIGCDKMVDYSFIAEHMLIKTTIMKDLINRIENSMVEGTIWFEKIINAVDVDAKNGFSEFETYGTFCSKYYHGLYSLKELRTFRDAGLIYGRNIKTFEIDKLKEDYHTASFEFRHFPKFPKNITQFIQSAFLVSLTRYRLQMKRLRIKMNQF
jgi:hypothetical protein